MSPDCSWCEKAGISNKAYPSQNTPSTTADIVAYAVLHTFRSPDVTATLPILLAPVSPRRESPVKALLISFRSRPVLHGRRGPNQLPPESGTNLCLVSGLLNLVYKLEVPLVLLCNTALGNISFEIEEVIIRELEAQGMILGKIPCSKTKMTTCAPLPLHPGPHFFSVKFLRRSHQSIEIGFFPFHTGFPGRTVKPQRGTTAR